jgi:exonuclease SbcD
VKLLATGDLHVGAGSQHREDALADHADTLNQILELARARDVDAILLAGDIFDRPKPTPAELHVFDRFIRALPCPAVAILGNAGHDQWGVDQPTALELFAGDHLRVSRHPEVILGPGDVAIATLPSVPVSRLVAAHGGGDRAQINEHAAELLLETARGLRDQVPDGWPCVLLGHWAVTGASLPNGLPVADLNEPVLSVDALEALDFNAVVLGHIHVPNEFGIDVLYVGSPLCLNFGEAGFTHGAWIVEVEQGIETATEFVQLDDRRFVTVDVDLIGSDPSSSASASPRRDRRAIAAAIIGRRRRARRRDRPRPLPRHEAQHRRVDQAAIRKLIADAGGRCYQIVPEIIREQRARVEGIDETLSPMRAVAAWAAANDLDQDHRVALHALTAELLEWRHEAHPSDSVRASAGSPTSTSRSPRGAPRSSARTAPANRRS